MQKSEDLYIITFINLKTGERDRYMNGTAFTLKEGLYEIDLLNQQQMDFEKNNFGKTRKDFKLRKINFLK